MKFSKFSTALIVRSDAKQLRYIWGVLGLFTLFQLWIEIDAVQKFDFFTLICVPIFLVLAFWLTIRFSKYASKDPTVVLQPIMAVGAGMVLQKIGTMIFASSGSIFSLLFECAFWILFVYTAIRAICGKMKLMIPLVLLFFAFFYQFIKYDLHAFAQIGAQLCLLLLLWLPIDAVTFTSLYDKINQKKG